MTRAAWWVFAFDFTLGVAFIVAALTDSGDAAGRGLAQVYALACVIALVTFAAILGVSTFFRSRVGLGLSIVMMAVPPILYLAGLARQIRW